MRHTSWRLAGSSRIVVSAAAGGFVLFVLSLSGPTGVRGAPPPTPWTVGYTTDGWTVQEVIRHDEYLRLR